jgi:hypothetical protein
MSKKKKRKPANRKPAKELFNPLAALQPLPAEKVTADMDRNYSALDAMNTQVGATNEQWIELSDVVNTVEMLIEMREIDQEHAATSQAAVHAMVAAMRRNVDHGEPMRLQPGEYEALRHVLGLYHVCLERKTWMMIYKAQKACTERINKQLAESRAAA